jgi:hypothetical protein
METGPMTGIGLLKAFMSEAPRAAAPSKIALTPR